MASNSLFLRFNNPVLVDTNAGIIAGHGRFLAARKLGLDEIPVVVLDHLSETQKRAYILADNRIGENAGWDEEVLAAELGDLQTADWRLDLLGFSEEELAKLLAETEPVAEVPAEVEKEIPEAPVDPVTRPGDVWLIGKHRLICGIAVITAPWRAYSTGYPNSEQTSRKE